MIHIVPLKSHPPQLQIPSDLESRFWYDDRQQRLCFDGFMSKATFDRLETLEDDPDFRLALEELFRISLPEDSHASGRWVAWVLAGAIILVAFSFGTATWIWLANR